jgi:hypothetical protein
MASVTHLFMADVLDLFSEDGSFTRTGVIGEEQG